MAGSPSQRIKPLVLMKILLEQTDEEHPLSAVAIIEKLAHYGIELERKSVYASIEVLQQFGLDILYRRGKPSGYYIGQRDFELVELKMLVDAVHAFYSISDKKSRELVRKLSKLASVHQAKQLERDILVAGHGKTNNERIFYNVDAIHNAIQSRKKIRFRYFDYTWDMNKRFRKDGGYYTQTPKALCWDANRYYLIAYSAKYDDLVSFRTDRMEDIELLSENADELNPMRFNLGQYIKENFGMFDGPNIIATIDFNMILLNVVREKFGYNTPIRKLNEDWFQITVEVSESPTLLGWLFQFDKYAVIRAPKQLIDSMREFLEKQLEKYQ